MQRVSSLLPLWERAKPASSNSNSNSKSGNPSSPGASSASNGPSGPNGHTDNNRSSVASSTSNLSTRHNRHSSNSALAKHGRPLNKVLSWADRFGGPRQNTLSVVSAGPSFNPPTAAPSATPAPVGRETYWPTNLDRECEKAARILKSFCTDGFLDEAADPTPTSPTSRTSGISLTSPRFPRRSADVPPTSPTASIAPVKKKIPPRIIQEAVGLAVFSCMRSGLWMSGSGGSGILIARKADGTWSPPSGIVLHTSTVAFVLGVDIYDCVLVINSVTALEMFTRPRLTLGTDVALTVGPLVSMGLLENDVRLNNDLGHTVLTYLKARGRHSPAQLAGSLVTERSNENARFYADGAPSQTPQPIDILDILAGNIRKSIPETIPLFEVIKAAEGRIDFDTAVMDRLSLQPAPGDADISDTPALLTPTTPSSATFGIPDATDPDPFGIIALEMAGLEIREAGSAHRSPSHQFDFTTSPTSPMFSSRFSRQSTDGPMDHANRASYLSARTQATSATDAFTQTDVAETPDTSLSPSHSDDGKDIQAATTAVSTRFVPDSRYIPSPVPELSVQPAPIDFDRDSIDARRIPSHTSTIIPDDSKATSTTPEMLTVDRAVGTVDMSEDDTDASSHYLDDERDEDADDEDDETDRMANELGDDVLDDLDNADDDEEPVIFEVATTSQPVRVISTQSTQIFQAKGAIVNIPKRIPPPLPLRSPARASRASKSEYGDLSNLSSPRRLSFLNSPTSDSQTEDPVDTASKARSMGAVVESVATESQPISIPVEDAPSKAEATPKKGSFPSSSFETETAVETSITPASMASTEKIESPTTPQATEPMSTSSVDESDREPQTPRPNDLLKTMSHHNSMHKEHNAMHKELVMDGETSKERKQNELDLEVDDINTTTVQLA